MLPPHTYRNVKCYRCVEEAKMIRPLLLTKSAVINHAMWAAHSLAFPPSPKSSSHVISVAQQKTQFHLLLQFCIRLCGGKRKLNNFTTSHTYGQPYNTPLKTYKCLWSILVAATTFFRSNYIKSERSTNLSNLYSDRTILLMIENLATPFRVHTVSQTMHCIAAVFES